MHFPCVKQIKQIFFEPWHGISNNVVCATSKASDQPAHGQSDQSLCLSLEYSMSVKLLTEQHLEFLKLKGGCTGSCEPTLVKMPHCRKSHVTAPLYNSLIHHQNWASLQETLI